MPQCSIRGVDTQTRSRKRAPGRRAGDADRDFRQGRSRPIGEARRGRSTRHAGELRNVERRRPVQAALGEHLQARNDVLRSIEAAERHEHQAREALEVAGVQPRPAGRTKVALQRLPGLGDIRKRRRLATEELEVVFGNPEERRRLATRRFLAIIAVAGATTTPIGCASTSRGSTSHSMTSALADALAVRRHP